jgi:SAM-dependent methyltransferase
MQIPLQRRQGRDDHRLLECERDPGEREDRERHVVMLALDFHWAFFSLPTQLRIAGVTRLYADDAELYDIAFDWDISDEADWLVDRLEATAVLEPGCGSGRMLEALAERGCQVAGLDASPQMIELARRRLGTRADLFEADMTQFELGRTFDGAVCPINTLLHLTPDELGRHLHRMSQHLERRSRYLVQVGLVAPDDEPFAGSHWDSSRGDTTLRVDWVDEEIDLVSGKSRQRSRIEVLSGPRAGEVLEEVHEMTAWTPATWAAAIEASPFEEVATYDGGSKGGWPRVDSGATGGLLWHELVV